MARKCVRTLGSKSVVRYLNGNVLGHLHGGVSLDI